jgi:hypothetical protein
LSKKKRDKYFETEGANFTQDNGVPIMRLTTTGKLQKKKKKTDLQRLNEQT